MIDWYALFSLGALCLTMFILGFYADRELIRKKGRITTKRFIYTAMRRDLTEK